MWTNTPLHAECVCVSSKQERVVIPTRIEEPNDNPSYWSALCIFSCKQIRWRVLSVCASGPITPEELLHIEFFSLAKRNVCKSSDCKYRQKNIKKELNLGGTCPFLIFVPCFCLSFSSVFRVSQHNERATLKVIRRCFFSFTLVFQFGGLQQQQKPQQHKLEENLGCKLCAKLLSIPTFALSATIARAKDRNKSFGHTVPRNGTNRIRYTWDVHLNKISVYQVKILPDMHCTRSGKNNLQSREFGMLLSFLPSLKQMPLQRIYCFRHKMLCLPLIFVSKLFCKETSGWLLSMLTAIMCSRSRLNFLHVLFLTSCLPMLFVRWRHTWEYETTSRHQNYANTLEIFRNEM